MDPRLIGLFETNRVPRYTSYPTAPHFKGFSEAEYLGLLAGIDADEPLSLYLHVPYCHKLCWYCGCTARVANRREPIERYAGLLARELDLLAERLAEQASSKSLPIAVPRLGHVHWGGGTPSSLGPELFTSLMQRVSRHFNLTGDAELAIELDPRSLDDAFIDAIADCGISRASFGIQSFDAVVQEAINRVQPFAQVADRVAALRGRGIDALSFDLLYGLPLQTLESCEATVDAVLELAPQRLAIFAYAHLPQRIKHQRLIRDADLPDAAARVAQYEAMRERLVAAGYVAIGIDHFALPHDDMGMAFRAGTLRRNFQGYTTDACDQLVGIGLSAISGLAGGYSQNTTDLKAYQKAIESGHLPIARGIATSLEDRCRRAIIEDLMCYGETDFESVAGRFGYPRGSMQPAQARLEDLARLGLARREGGRIAMAPDMQPFVRLAAACFDSYLDPAGGLHAAAL